MSDANREQFEAWARTQGRPHYVPAEPEYPSEFFSKDSWEAWQAGKQKVPMTRQQTDAMFAEVQRRATQLEDEGRYSFGGWFPIAVELIEAHHGIVETKEPK